MRSPKNRERIVSDIKIDSYISLSEYVLLFRVHLYFNTKSMICQEVNSIIYLLHYIKSDLLIPIPS